jgi:hypothetical protein
MATKKTPYNAKNSLLGGVFCYSGQLPTFAQT